MKKQIENLKSYHMRVAKKGDMYPMYILERKEDVSEYPQKNYAWFWLLVHIVFWFLLISLMLGAVWFISQFSMSGLY